MNTKDTPIDKTPEYYIDQHLLLNSTVDDEQGDIVFIMREYADQQNASIKLELQKQKELNAELVNCLKDIKNWVEYEGENPYGKLESLIKKSSEI